MNEIIDYDAYARENRSRFRARLLQLAASRPGRAFRTRPRDLEEQKLLLEICRLRKKRWLEEGDIVETGNRQYRVLIRATEV